MITYTTTKAIREINTYLPSTGDTVSTVFKKLYTI